MLNEFKYDIALSLSDSDSEIADKLYEALTSYSVNLTVYYYNKERASQLGADLKIKSFDVYMHQTRHIVILASKDYLNGEWAGFEWKLARIEDSKRPYRFILPVRLDDSPIERLSSDIIFEKWQNNPRELADLIKQAIDIENQKSERYQSLRSSTDGEINLYAEGDSREGTSESVDPALPIGQGNPKPHGNKWKVAIIQVAIGLIITVLGAYIVNWMGSDDGNNGNPHPFSGLSIKASGHTNKGIFLNSNPKAISSLNDSGIGIIQGVSLHDTLHLGTGRHRSNQIIITQEHINNGEIIYSGN